MNHKELLGQVTVREGVSHEIVFIRAWHAALGVPLEMPRDALNEFHISGDVPAYVISYCENILRRDDAGSGHSDYDEVWFGN